MATHYLDFERPIGDLEAKIEELSKLSDQAGAGAFDTEIDALRSRVDTMRRDAYAKLDTWQKTQVARHPERPHTTHYIAGLIDDFVDLKYYRRFGDDQAIVGGMGKFRKESQWTVIGHGEGPRHHHAGETQLRLGAAGGIPQGYPG